VAKIESESEEEEPDGASPIRPMRRSFMSRLNVSSDEDVKEEKGVDDKLPPQQKKEFEEEEDFDSVNFQYAQSFF
jgi:hypothetical protein